MTTEFFVIAGCLRIGIERCWKRLCEGQWYSWKSRFVKPFLALFKENSQSFDLKHSVFWCVIDPGPSVFLGHPNWWLQAESVSGSRRSLFDCRGVSPVHLPVPPGRSLAFSK